MTLRLTRLFPAILALVLAAHTSATGQSRPGEFDYYVLSLSWSPSYCGSAAGRDDDSQCRPGRRFAFVVHGLWPQFHQGWPESCRTRDLWLPERQIQDMMDIMPSRRLVIHEWRKHGTCSGLSQKEYFALVRTFRDKLRVPARYLSPLREIRTTPQQLQRDFVLSNRGLAFDMLSVQCGNAQDSARLAELRICLDRSGDFTPCGRNEARRCRARVLVMPEVR
jgi:ribonuclease T2